MNNITEKNVREFIDAINRDALEECKKIETESEQFVKTEYELAKRRIKAEVEESCRYELTKIKTQTNREISRLVHESEKEVVTKREKIAEHVFNEALEKLSLFAKSDKYGDFLSLSAKKIIDALGDEGLTLFLREEDMAFSEKIKEDTKTTASFQTDSSIKTGGLKGKCGTTLADDTLDTRLEEQMEWFKANSGLTVR